MSLFAQVDEQNTVINVIVADASFVASQPGTWIETSTDGSVTLNYASIGSTYRQDLNAFIPPQPFPSWTLNTTTLAWDAPVPYPSQNLLTHRWDEAQLNWVER